MIIEALLMGKHGPYVWSSYAVFFLCIFGWILHFSMAFKNHWTMLDKKRKREEVYSEITKVADTNVRGVSREEKS